MRFPYPIFFRFSLLLPGLLASIACTTYKNAIEKLHGEWQDAEFEPPSEVRQLALHSAFAPGGDSGRIVSLSVTDGRPIKIGRLALRYAADAPNFSLRVFELEKLTLATNAYWENGSVYRAYAEAASTAIHDVFGDALHANAELIIIPAGVRVNEAFKSRVENGAFSVRFYITEDSAEWIDKFRNDLKILSHEVFHAYDQLVAGADKGGSNQILLNGLGETSASLFAKCVELDVFGKATVYRDPAPTFDGRKIAFKDSELLTALDRNYDDVALTAPERRIIGDIFAWSLWLEFVGSKWEVRADEASAPRLRALCARKVLADREGLSALIRSIASDGNDAPEFDLSS